MIKIKNMSKVVILLLLTIGSCERPFLFERFYSIEINNESNDTICTYLAEGGDLTEYPDTTLPITDPGLIKIAPSNSFFYDSRIEWKELITELSSDTLSVFIIDNSIYQSHAWSEIRSQYIILKRLDLSISDLENLDWTIPYP
jgi:hypothetical protein